MANMGQDIKEAMTGGSVAVVGKNSVLTENIADKQVTPEKTDFIEVVTSVNEFNKAEAVLNKYMRGDNVLIETNKYYYYKLKIKPGDIIRSTYNSDFANNPALIYDENDNKIASKSTFTDYQVIDLKYWQLTAPANSSYILINCHNSRIDENMITLNNEYPNEYVPYIRKCQLNNTIKIANNNLDLNLLVESLRPELYKSNPLYGKKWCACGDSITYGAKADADEAGNKKTYAYYIAKNNGMTLSLNAISGSTMMNVSGKNPFSVDRYKNLPADLDYITLAFVTNDSAQDVSLIGNIDDKTNDTFYGAWNVVLQYLITNYPTTKIGIIGFWRGNQKYQYTDALRSVAKKYRIPFLDFMFDYNIPIIGGTDFRSYNPNATNEVIVDYNTLNLRQKTFLADGVHPNDIGYKYMSTIIENWLKSL